MRSRKMRGGGDPTEPTMKIPVSAINALAATATKLAGELGNLIPSVAPAEPAVQSDLSATAPSVPAAVEQSNVQSGDDAAPSVPSEPVVVPNVQDSEPVVATPSVPSEPGDNAVSNENAVAASEPVATSATVAAPSVPAFKSDPNIKFQSSNPGLNKVTLSYPRIIMLLNKLKNTNADKANLVLSELTAATTQDEVQSIINKNQLNLYGNAVTGGTKKRRMNKNKMTKRKKARHSRR